MDLSYFYQIDQDSQVSLYETNPKQTCTIIIFMGNFVSNVLYIIYLFFKQIPNYHTNLLLCLIPPQQKKWVPLKMTTICLPNSAQVSATQVPRSWRDFRSYQSGRNEQVAIKPRNLTARVTPPKTNECPLKRDYFSREYI